MASLKNNLEHQRHILAKLYLIRDLEEAIAARYQEGKMRCPTHLSIGQEGAPSALAPLISHADFAVSTHRAHAHYLAKGGCPNAMIAEIYGKATGCSGGRGGSMHLIDESVGFKGSTAIVGNTIPLGVGLALSQKMRKQDDLTVVYLGDGATEEGVFYESVNFAILKNLPVLFVCENNLYSVYTGLEKRQPAKRVIVDMVAGLGCKTFSGDGNNIAESYDIFQQAITFIRSGNGPVFVELATYRWREHCGPNYDNHIGYRSEQEFLTWQEKDPIKQFEHWLLEQNSITPEELTATRNSIGNIITDAFAFAEASEFPPQESLAHHIYREVAHD